MPHSASAWHACRVMGVAGSKSFVGTLAAHGGASAGMGEVGITGKGGAVAMFAVRSQVGNTFFPFFSSPCLMFFIIIE